LLNPLFSTSLLAQGWQDRSLSPPHDIPVLAITGDPAQDTYIDVNKVHDWAVRLAGDDVEVDAIGCPGARHAVDNEVWPTGADVLIASRGYLDGVLSAHPQRVTLASCRMYEHVHLEEAP
jgi:hypothetical protein